MPYSFTRQSNGETILHTDVNELQVAIESLSTDAESYLDETETQALIDAAITGSGELPASPGTGYGLASLDAPDVAEWRLLPARNILDVIDPVASDHTDEIKDAFEEYPHWYIPPETTVRIQERLRHPVPRTCIEIPYHGSLTGRDPLTSVIQITTDQYTPGDLNADDVYAVFFLNSGGTADTQPRQHIAMLNVLGSADTPMAWTEGQASVFYENNNEALQTIIRDAPVTVDRLRVTAYSGFPFHSETARVIASNCDFIDCGNGFNVNGMRSSITKSYFERSEGCEMAGIGMSITDNVFLTPFMSAIAVGGFYSPGHPEINASYVAGNRIYGQTENGVSIIVGQTMSDTMLVHNYIESAYIAIQSVNDPAYLTNGILIQGNTIVSAELLGMRIGDANCRILGNRIYSRDDLATTSSGMQFEGDDLLVDGNVVAGIANYSTTFSGSQNMLWGPANVMAAGINSGFVYAFDSNPTFRGAQALSADTRAISGGSTLVVAGDRRLFVDCAGSDRTSLFWNLSAAGKPGYELSFQKVTAGNTWTIDPMDSETIDGASTYVLTDQWDSVSLVSDGTNWVITGSRG